MVGVFGLGGVKVSHFQISRSTCIKMPYNAKAD